MLQALMSEEARGVWVGGARGHRGAPAALSGKGVAP